MQQRAKPSHHAAAYGAWFKDLLIAQAYPSRPPYPDDVITHLTSLVVPAAGQASAVLDLGQERVIWRDASHRWRRRWGR